MFVFVVEKWAETRMGCYIDPISSSLIAALLPHLGLGCSTGVTKSPKSSVWSWFSLRHLVYNWFTPSRHLVILFSNVHLLPLFFHLFTQVHLLIDGSVEGQYITHELWLSKKLVHRCNVFTQPLYYGQDATQGYFWRVLMVWIQSFPSRLVALPESEKQFCCPISS